MHRSPAFVLLLICVWCASCGPRVPPAFDPTPPSPNVLRWPSSSAALKITGDDPRAHLYCGPSVFGDQRVIAIRCSAQVLLHAGTGRLRAYVVVHGGQRIFKDRYAGRIVRPGELHHGERMGLALEVKLDGIAHHPDDRYELVLANEAGSTLALSDVHITSVTADVPGRPLEGSSDSMP